MCRYFIFFVTLFSQLALASVSQPDFDAVLDRVASLYAQQVKDEGGILDMRRQYTYPEYVGSARRWEGKWIVELWGGFPHDPVISKESLAMVVCHEFGHHFAGAPFNEGSGEPWASVEGQADTFAAGTCLPAYLEQFEAPVPEENPLPETVEICAEVADVYCTRVMRAAYEFATVIGQQQKNPPPSFSTPDLSVVEKTEVYHAQAQCRLDTMIAGYFQKDRPRCWFKPD